MRRPISIATALVALGALAALPGCGATIYDAGHAPVLVPICTSDAQPIACAGASACAAEDDDHCGAGCDDCLANAIRHGRRFCDRSSPDRSQHACVTTCEAGFVNDPNGPGCVCDAGQVACGAGGACVVETTSSCGASCQSCSAPAGALPTCTNHACDYVCPGGKVQCTNAATGQPDCCVPACGAQQVQCGAACVSESTAQCGPSCADCTAPSNAVPANASPACLGPAGQGACSFACDPGFLKSNGACVQIAPGAGKVALGASHTCAITTAGGVMCWGNNGAGQLGVGDAANRLAPADVALAGGATPAFISAGVSHTCAVTTAGAVQCWGSNQTAQLGLPLTTTSSPRPAPVPGLTGVASVAAGAGHTCALLADGTVKCWGANDKAQAGQNPAATQLATSPTAVNLTGPMTQIATQLDHTCALKGNGQVLCWGWNLFGQTGTSPSPNPSLPGGAVSSLVASSISVGGTHTCAVGSVNTSSGVYCWGDRSSGQLGDGATAPNLSVPTLASRLAPAAGAADRLLTGRAHTCDARAADGAAICAGANLSLQVGKSPPSSGELQGPTLSLGPIEALAGAGDRSCAVVTGTLRCWGANEHGQLGDGTTADSASPVSPRPF
jgi:hypothetical protein